MSSETLAKKKTARPFTPLDLLSEQLQKTVKQIEGNQTIPADLAAAIAKAYNLAVGIDPYLNDVTTSESIALTQLKEKTCAEDWAKRFSDGETVRQLEQEMLSGHVQGQILKMFVCMSGAKSILEVGMFTGYSALAMAEGLPDGGRLVACEVDEYVANFAKECFKGSPHGSKIEVKVAPALETMKQLAEAGESFDLAFLDADKKEYLDYFNLLVDSNLLAPNGFICADNTLYQGQVYLPAELRSPNGEAIDRFNRAVAADPRVEQVLLPLRDGLSVIRRKQ